MAISEANDVINALMQALAVQPATGVEMTAKALDKALAWQNKDWDSESPMTSDMAISEANDVINALMQALAVQPATGVDLATAVDGGRRW
jgi:hypothetical protein